MRRRLSPFGGAVLFLLCIFLVGCSKELVRPGQSDREMFELGKRLMEQEEYQDAITVFRELNNRHPSSPLVEEALFNIALAYYLDEMDVDAEVAFDDFLRLYPASPLVPKALLYKGLTIERAVEPPGRDQDPAREALSVYRDLVARYPDAEEARKGRERIEALRSHLARHEMEIARFYIKKDKFDAAVYRLRRALESYGDTRVGDDLKLLLGIALARSGKLEEARKILHELERSEFPPEGIGDLREEIREREAEK